MTPHVNTLRMVAQIVLHKGNKLYSSDERCVLLGWIVERLDGHAWASPLWDLHLGWFCLRLGLGLRLVRVHHARGVSEGARQWTAAVQVVTWRVGEPFLQTCVKPKKINIIVDFFNRYDLVQNKISVIFVCRNPIFCDCNVKKTLQEYTESNYYHYHHYDPISIKQSLGLFKQRNSPEDKEFFNHIR